MTVINSASSLVNATQINSVAASTLNKLSSQQNAVQKVTSHSVTVTLSSQAQAISAVQNRAAVAAPPTEITAADIAKKNLTEWTSYLASNASISVFGSSADVSSVLDRLQAAGAKVAAITLSNSDPLNVTAAQLKGSTTTLKKIAGSYTMNVTGALAADVSKTIATKIENTANKSSGTVVSIAVSDTAAKITAALTSLGSSVSKISSISQSDSTGLISLTASQMSTNAVLLSKLDKSVRLNVTAVAYANVKSAFENINVVSVGLAMTTTEVASNLADLKARIGENKISAIALQGASTTLSLSVADIADNAAVLGKISSKFTLSLSSSTIAAGQLSKLDDATLKLLPSTAKLTVTGSAADIQANFVKLQALVAAKKIDKIAMSADANLTLSFADAKKYSAVLSTVKSGKITVQFSGSYNQYSVVQGAGGSFALTDQRSGIAAANKESGTLAGVNFFKFSDITTFASSGDSNVDAVLNGGKNMWWYNDKGAAPSSDPINGAFTTLASTSSKTKLTYSFLKPSTVDPSASASEKAMTEMNAVQKQAVKDAFGYLSSLVNVEFTDVSGQKDSNNNDLTGKADINFGMNIQGASAGYANPPHASGAHPSYLFLASNQASNNSFEKGTYGWETLVHEIGHTMGLKHPFNGNAGGGGAPQPYLPTATNNRNFSIMSYTDASNTADINITFKGGDNGSYGVSYTAGAVNPSTFMTYDIAALQYLYGQNKDENIYKDLTVTFGADFKGIKTIYAPINGSMDASATTKNNVFDLRGGGYSTIGYSMQDQVTAQLKQQKATDEQITSVLNNAKLKLKPAIASSYNGQNTVGLAFGSHITSVTGGSAKDQFYVNGSDDVTIDGGAGTDDTVYLAGSAADWKIVATQTALTGTTGTLAADTKLTNGTETLTLKNVEKFAFYNLTDSLTHTA